MTKSNRRTIRALTAGGTLLFTAAIALGTTTLGYPAIAGADPNNGGGTSGSGEWDIGAYDFCMKNHPPLYTIEDKPRPPPVVLRIDGRSLGVPRLPGARGGS